MCPSMAKKRKAREKSPEQELASSESEDEEEEEEGKEMPSSDQSSSSSDGVGSEESDSEAESPLSSPSSTDLVDVDFEFFDPKPDDFHGAKALLKTYLDDETWDINGFVDIFLSQTTVGSVIKTSEDESPIGIISALNLAKRKDSPCMQEIHRYLLHKAQESSETQAAKHVETFWTKKAKDVGLIVCERLINIPIELIPPLYDGLFEEVQWATEDEPTRALQDSFKFKHYLLLTKVYEELPKKGNSSSSQQPVAQVKESKNLVFLKPEDEIFLKLSSWSFTFPVKGEASAGHETKDMRLLRLVMGVDTKQIPVFATLLKGLAQ